MDIKVLMLGCLFSMITALYHLANWRIADPNKGE